MRDLGADEETISQLKTRRNLLFKKFETNPSNTSLAIEIRLIDDRIAESNLLTKKRCDTGC